MPNLSNTQIRTIRLLINSQPELSNTEIARQAGRGCRASNVAVIRKEITGSASTDRWRGPIKANGENNV